MRLRAKLQRWELEDGRRHAVIFGNVQERTPAWQGRRASHLLQVLGGLSPPRVQAAVFSTLFNRWTTARRFQGHARCLFGCGDGSEDSIEHYCRCGAVRAVFQRKLRLDPGVFCNLHTFLLVNPRIRSKEVLSVLGLAIYAVYTCTNTMRHRGRCDFEVAVDAITQAVREGAKGHRVAMRTLRSRWTTSTEEAALPPLPPTSFPPRVESLRRGCREEGQEGHRSRRRTA